MEAAIDATRHPNAGRGVLLTGATGFLGGEILARLLQRGDCQVYALVRARDQGQAEARLRETIISLLGTIDPWSRRAVAIPADLRAAGLGLSESHREWLAERTTEIIHCAASVSFELGLEESRRINLDGTIRMLQLAEFASICGGLDCFTHVSTAYVAGTYPGSFGEGDPRLGQGFRNGYERSKFEAEVMVRSRSDSLPIQVLRPSIVVGDSRSGWTSTFNVLYWPLRAFARGSYSVLPARRSAPVDVVPVDYVADSVIALAGRPGTTYNLAAGERASTMGEVAELAGSYFKAPPPRLISPRLYRRAVHPLLLRTGDQRRRTTLRRSEQFFPYFEVGARYDAAGAGEALAPAGLEPPPLSSYFERLMDFAVAADWGRKPVPRHRAVCNLGEWPTAPTLTRSPSRSRRNSRAARTV
jgi:nucleoside-diphosphate-sugar epimerase